MLLLTEKIKLTENGEKKMYISNLGKIQQKGKTIDENEEYKKCQYCVEYKKEKCSLASCPYLLERAEYGQVQYKHFVKGSFAQYKEPSFKKRLKYLKKAFCGDLFNSPAHNERFYKALDEKQISFNTKSASYIAILFLLTADNSLWTMTKKDVYSNSFDFKQMNIVDISTDGYALFQVAKKINDGKTYNDIEEFGDETLITDSTFKAIVNAMLIAKSGLVIFSLNK